MDTSFTEKFAFTSLSTACCASRYVSYVPTTSPRGMAGMTGWRPLKGEGVVMRPILARMGPADAGEGLRRREHVRQLVEERHSRVPGRDPWRGAGFGRNP